MRNNLILLITICSITFSACTKDTSSPIIEITSPTTTTSFAGGLALIEGVFSDSEKLGKLEFKSFVNGGEPEVFKTVDDFDSKKSHDFREIYILDNGLAVGDIFSLEVHGYDAAGNNTTARVDVTIE